MANISTNTREELLAKRDARIKPHLEQYAPVWLVDEIVILEDEAVQFNVVFLHSVSGDDMKPVWVNRRYRYDGFNNTVYHKGQTMLTEEAVVEMTASTPFIDTLVTDAPNAYGG